MVGAVASCAVKGPGTPARCYPVGCRPRRKEGKGKVEGLWQGVGGEAGRRELHSGGRRREREGRERERQREREREREGE